MDCFKSVFCVISASLLSFPGIVHVAIVALHCPACVEVVSVFMHAVVAATARGVSLGV